MWKNFRLEEFFRPECSPNDSHCKWTTCYSGIGQLCPTLCLLGEVGELVEEVVGREVKDVEEEVKLVVREEVKDVEGEGVKDLEGTVD